ncbi:MAG: nitrile hydratase subunit beta [Chloroflexi bacterium]|nr:nitrile hydratase subunit beta [Chloroflexota bacterium]
MTAADSHRDKPFPTQSGEPRRHHDVGGLPAGPVDTSTHALDEWEQRTDALVYLLSARKAIRVDELRRAIESLGPAEYADATYYHRWLHGLTRLLLEKGVLTVSGLALELARLNSHARE